MALPQGNINVSPETLKQFECAVVEVQEALREKHKITTFDFKSTISASAKLGESMFSANSVRDVTADFYQAYVDKTDAIIKVYQDVDSFIATQQIGKLSVPQDQEIEKFSD